VGEYIGHLAVGAAMFSALLFFGVGLNLLIKWLEGYLEPAFLLAVRLVEAVILYADVVLLLCWTAFATYNAIVALRHE
jgi:hypothetical protein